MKHALDWQNLRLLQNPVSWLIASLLFAATGGLIAQGLSRHLAHRQDALQKQFSEMHAAEQARKIALRSAHEDLHYLPALEASGLQNHREDRLTWVEGLSAINRDHPESPLQYRITAQRLLTPQAQVGNSRLLASILNLKYTVRHEADFSRVHHDLRALPGKPLPLRCSMKRASSAGLDVDCDYAWIVLSQSGRNPAGKQP